MSEKLRDKILKEMTEIPEEWKDKLHTSTSRKGMLFTRYGLGRDYTEGYDYLYVYFTNQMSAKMFLNKHHKSCF